MSKDQNAVALGRKGGRARAAKLTSEERIAIARKGYHASPLSIKRANIEQKPKNPSKEGISINH